MKKFVFPEKFLWGAATSSHQVEGDNIHNDWWAWEEAGRVPFKSGPACQHYSRYPQDFALAKSLAHNSHRFSIEWSRLEPQEGQWDEAELRHYRQVLEVLKNNGLTPMVTLHHFTSPQWFIQKGGWLLKTAAANFLSYVERLVEGLGDLVPYWVIFNEPMVYVYRGYVTGEWPPGLQSSQAAGRVSYALIKTHCLGYRLIHTIYQKRKWGPVWVGVAKHLRPFFPHSSHISDTLVVKIRDYFFNWDFLKRIRFNLDFIGVNYYTRDFVQFAWGMPHAVFGKDCPLLHGHTRGQLNLAGWESYPEGLSPLLIRLKSLRLPIIITENGTCVEDDTLRWDFIYRHLESVARALEGGSPVCGYFYWSLLDNFEWEKGFGPRFGLVEVDYASQERKVRSSAEKFAEVCRENALCIS